MADNNILLTNATETTENNSRKDFETSSNPNDSAFMPDELLMMQEFADEE